jgi:hypothetical protein
MCCGRHSKTAANPLGAHDHEVRIGFDEGPCQGVCLSLSPCARRCCLLVWVNDLESELH